MGTPIPQEANASLTEKDAAKPRRHWRQPFRSQAYQNREEQRLKSTCAAEYPQATPRALRFANLHEYNRRSAGFARRSDYAGLVERRRRDKPPRCLLVRSYPVRRFIDRQQSKISRLVRRDTARIDNRGISGLF